jgi:nucleotide-binding universal stress UspA family protein
MTIARICAPLSGASDSQAVAAVGCALAVRFRAQVTGCFVRKSLEPYAQFAALDGSAALQSSLLASGAPAQDEKREYARNAFEAACRRLHLAMGPEARPPSCAWAGEIGGPRELGSAARLNDLIVVAQPGEYKNDGQADVLDAALFRARRSILIVNDDVADVPLNSVAIAYDGSAEAARAVTCALPFLREARQVNILTVGRVADHAPTVQDLIGYLAGHGMKAAHRPALEVSASIGNTLLGIAQVFDTDLLVMGAYSHSKLRERVLGGVTRFMLESAAIPILMAH